MHGSRCISWKTETSHARQEGDTTWARQGVCILVLGLFLGFPVKTMGRFYLSRHPAPGESFALRDPSVQGCWKNSWQPPDRHL